MWQFTEKGPFFHKTEDEVFFKHIATEGALKCQIKLELFDFKVQKRPNEDKLVNTLI